MTRDEVITGLETLARAAGTEYADHLLDGEGSVHDLALAAIDLIRCVPRSLEIDEARKIIAQDAAHEASLADFYTGPVHQMRAVAYQMAVVGLEALARESNATPNFWEGVRRLRKLLGLAEYTPPANIVLDAAEQLEKLSARLTMAREAIKQVLYADEYQADDNGVEYGSPNLAPLRLAFASLSGMKSADEILARTLAEKP